MTDFAFFWSLVSWVVYVWALRMQKPRNFIGNFKTISCKIVYILFNLTIIKKHFIVKTVFLPSIATWKTFYYLFLRVFCFCWSKNNNLQVLIFGNSRIFSILQVIIIAITRFSEKFTGINFRSPNEKIKAVGCYEANLANLDIKMVCFLRENKYILEVIQNTSFVLILSCKCTFANNVLNTSWLFSFRKSTKICEFRENLYSWKLVAIDMLNCNCKSFLAIEENLVNSW